MSKPNTTAPAVDLPRIVRRLGGSGMINGKKLCGEELEKALAAMPQADIESLFEDLDALDIMEPSEESFTAEQIVRTLKAWLEYGRQTYKADKHPDELGHTGYFSGEGFAARVLKHVIAKMERSDTEPNVAGEATASNKLSTP